MPRRLARTLVVTLTLAALSILANAPTALAYGSTDQWQAGFSGTCSSQSSCPFGFVPANGATGFWGWCTFGGSNGSSAVGTTGTTGDCQVTTYFGPHSTFHISFDGAGWAIQAGSPFVIPPGAPDFLFTKVTVELSGPGAPAPTGVPFTFIYPNCPPMVCDTGVPAIAGHFSFHAPGAEFNIQVTRLP